jgi:hypothetical protein
MHDVSAMSDVSDDGAAAVAFLRELGAPEVAHLGGDLLTHLQATEAVLRGWGVDGDVARAGLCHAAYGTDGFAPHLLELHERARLREVIGTRAEGFVYRYASCDRGSTYPRLGEQPLPFVDRFDGSSFTLDDDDAEAFALVTAANELDLVGRGVVSEEAADSIRTLVRALVPYAPDVLQAVVG